MDNNINVSKMLETLSKMNKNDLEKGISQLNNILNSNDKQQIINKLQNQINNK